MPILSCRICQKSGDHKVYAVKEMMFGLGENFDYFQCSACGCLQIKEIPANLEKYYPKEYYSLQKLDFKDAPALKAWLRKLRASNYVHSAFNLEALWSLLFGRQDFFQWLKTASIGINARILDIGAGSGSFLRDLRIFGYKDLTGLEPFIGEDLHYALGFQVLKKHVSNLDGSYDFITSNHSLEHMSDPLPVLKEFHRLLNPGGQVLIRIPVVNSYAWESYGVNWVQLDAPRHLFLHSLQSMQLLAEQAGFKIKKVNYDSSDFQFWGSEQYQKGISLKDPRSYGVSRKNSMYSRWDIMRFRSKAKKLNREGRGDSVCFYLIKN